MKWRKTSENPPTSYEWILILDKEWYEDTLIYGSSIDVTLFSPEHDLAEFDYWMPIPKKPEDLK
ncbi:MAG: hypothetical protein AAF600_11005 [Bacteroidota bacterium]